MKKLSKKNVLIVLSIILSFSFLISANSYYLQDINNGYVKIDNEHSLKSAGFWNLGPIEIDDDDPTKNWLITATTYDWCTGSGIINDPYRIENVTINGGGSMSCIDISNSEVYFIIKNCTVFNSGNGIYLTNVKNGSIIKSNCSNNGNGIKIDTGDSAQHESSFNIVDGNIINNNSAFGLYLGTL
ncbi:MAG: right-handed parallel beta-helix repeat-containing protein, partial [Promethearchaeota archaeon]